MLSFNCCRFCDDRDQGLVKYSVRHYAHFHCYLDAGRPLEALTPWQVAQFPYFLLKERGLIERARLITSRGDSSARAPAVPAGGRRLDACSPLQATVRGQCGACGSDGELAPALIERTYVFACDNCRGISRRTQETRQSQTAGRM